MKPITEFHAYPRRFLVLTWFWLANATNEFFWICFSPIFASVGAVFDVSSFSITLLPLSFMILFLPGSLLAVYLHEKTGLRATILTGTVLQAFGAWIRYAACAIVASNNDSGSGKNNNSSMFLLLILGQCIAALAQPVFTNLPPRVSGVWFPASERNRATVMAVMANPIGNALGSALPSLFVSSISSSGVSIAEVSAQLSKFVLSQAILATVIAIGVWMQVEERPPTPSSAASAAQEEYHEQAQERTRMSLLVTDNNNNDDTDTDAKGGIRIQQHTATTPPSSSLKNNRAVFHMLKNEYKQLLFENRNFLFLLFGFGIGLGIFNAILSLLGQILSNCGYDSEVSGFAGAFLLGTGLCTAAISGILLERTRAYVPLLRTGIGTVLIATASMLLLLRPGVTIPLYAICAVLGAAVVPLLPVSLENAAECTFPIREDTSASALTMMGKYLGAGFTFALQPMLSLSYVSSCETVITPSAGLILSSLIVAAICIGLFQKDYRRQEGEKKYLKEKNPRNETITAAAVDVGGDGGEDESGVRVALLR